MMVFLLKMVLGKKSHFVNLVKLVNFFDKSGLRFEHEAKIKSPEDNQGHLPKDRIHRQGTGTSEQNRPRTGTPRH